METSAVCLFCGATLLPYKKNKKFCCYEHRIRFRQIMVAKETFRLDEAEAELRKKYEGDKK